MVSFKFFVFFLFCLNTDKSVRFGYPLNGTRNGLGIWEKRLSHAIVGNQTTISRFKACSRFVILTELTRLVFLLFGLKSERLNTDFGIKTTHHMPK